MVAVRVMSVVPDGIGRGIAGWVLGGLYRDRGTTQPPRAKVPRNPRPAERAPGALAGAGVGGSGVVGPSPSRVQVRPPIPLPTLRARSV